MWSRFARELSAFSSGCYWSDLFLSSEIGGKAATPFIQFLQAFVRGPVHLHFAEAAAAEQALRDCGFAEACLLDPADHAQAIGGGQAVSRSVRVVEARATTTAARH